MLVSSATVFRNKTFFSSARIPQLINYCFIRVIMSSKILSVDFEVFGRVQGVFFRKFTQEQANSLGLKGWCMNTSDGTVKGSIEGEPEKVEAMKKWLSTVGSPYSKIDKATFSNEKQVTEYTYDNFSVKR